MSPEEILKEYEKGCSCAERKPSDCRDCLNAAVRAIDAYKSTELATLRAEVERLRDKLKWIGMSSECQWAQDVAKEALK